MEEAGPMTIDNGTSSGWRIAIDRGGTFTDVVAITPDNRLVTDKLLSDKAGHVEPVPVEVRHDVLDIIEHPERPSHRVAKSTVFQAKEMTVDEAILQLDLLGSQFFVFQNAADRAINVLYRREDASLGLIEARSS